MLVAANRLRSAKDIGLVYKRGSYGAGGRLLSVKAAANGLPTWRAAVVVSKKVDKRATVRNRLRRRLTEWLRRHQETVSPGYDIVITVHADFQAVSEAELTQLLHTALQRARAIIVK